jgi:hypothetical protein
MTVIKHLSMRVPWRDQPWDENMCAHPLDNSSCLLLKNIGINRDDQYEAAHAGEQIESLDQSPPCRSERGTFMSDHGYQVTKTHPYATYEALKGHVHATVLAVPAHSFEGVPFRWLARKTFEEELWPVWRARYDPDAEDRVQSILGLNKAPNWIMDGRNQQSVIRKFFEPVAVGPSLVFIYLKHSPFQDDRTDRLLVGAAHISDIQFPAFWRHSGSQPFDSSMWETIVIHSLRRDQKAGILLPYQQLVEKLDVGEDISAALAWVPDGKNEEFSYVTDHVSSDTAIDALSSLRTAADGFNDLGIEVPASATAWVDAQVDRLWDERGSTPGLASVLAYLTVEQAYVVARAATDAASDPWEILEAGFADPTTWPRELIGRVTASVGQEWKHLDSQLKTVLKLLSTMDVRPDQVALIMNEQTSGGLEAIELLDDPYLAAICTYDDPGHVSFNTIDRSLFPAAHVKWASVVPDVCRMAESRDWRRVRALMTEGLRAAAQRGDTIVGAVELIEWVNGRELNPPVQISAALLKGQGLDAETLAADTGWLPFYGARLGDDRPAYKLLELVDAKETICSWIRPRLTLPHFEVKFDPRQQIDQTLHASGHGVVVDGDEEAARTEKASGLAELYKARVSVLVGPAGTGKTTLLKALADLSDVSSKGVLLLAPTGKASVQLSAKVGRRAQTLASFLVRKKGYDPDRDIYQLVDPKYSHDAGLVVIDEASMLTEPMLAATLSALGHVERLVLVGDPRQLPPIGAGRPFVDLVNHLQPDLFEEAARVGPSYVELTVSRRQGGSDRDDVLLAQWFGDGELGAGADMVWERLRSGTSTGHLEHRPWTLGDPIKSIDEVLEEELDWTGHEDREIAFKLTYGGILSADGRYLNWKTGADGAGDHAEDWQILSPYRSRIFGTTEINRHIKRTLRAKDLDLTTRRGRGVWRNARPIGPEQIVRGDKVMQTRNNSQVGAEPRGTGGLDYVANGEIGVVVGSWGQNPRSPAKVEFSSQIGWTYTYWPNNTEDPPLELAWAVTVHKSQGSEFGKTILVLPKRVTLSRELLYTALTRQTDRVVILHDGTVDELLELAHPRYSETARRITDLFAASTPRVIEVDGVPQPFDGKLVHVADNGVMVRSKNEVIVADILEKSAPGRWRYEVLLQGDDGSWCRPDFTITTPGGFRVYWEHLGMMNQPSYARRWAQKLEWYKANGILPVFDQQGNRIQGAEGGPNGILMWTDDVRGVDKPAWRAMAEAILGSSSAGRRRRRPT